jgi:hypothetical protein
VSPFFFEAHKWYNVAPPRTTHGDIRNEIMKRRDDLSLKMTDNVCFVISATHDRALVGALRFPRSRR